MVSPALLTFPSDVPFRRQLQPPGARLMAHVRTTDTCWLWEGLLLQSGYGQIRIDGQRWRVHRLAWVLAFGPIPDGLFVCHHCDVRNCVNPDHLFLGTTDDNMRDMVIKGRQAHGVTHGRAKLTPDQVVTLRTRHATGGATVAGLAREYGVSRPAITAILRGKHWKL